MVVLILRARRWALDRVEHVWTESPKTYGLGNQRLELGNQRLKASPQSFPKTCGLGNQRLERPPPQHGASLKHMDLGIEGSRLPNPGRGLVFWDV